MKSCEFVVQELPEKTTKRKRTYGQEAQEKFTKKNLQNSPSSTLLLPQVVLFLPFFKNKIHFETFPPDRRSTSSSTRGAHRCRITLSSTSWSHRERRLLRGGPGQAREGWGERRKWLLERGKSGEKDRMKNTKHVDETLVIVGFTVGLLDLRRLTPWISLPFW